MILEDKLKKFEKKGTVTLEEILDKNQCYNLLKQIKNTRNWSQDLFRSKEDFEKDPQMQKTNPGRGIQNLAEEYDLDFIEKNEIFIQCLNNLVGKDYEILLKKFVVGVPENWVPDWLKLIISKKLVANLGPYIKKEFRNVTYFRGIDYHMDLIDHPGQTGDYVTVYVYLNDVNLKMSPLHLIEASHEYGPTKFPHFIKDDKEDSISYGIDEHNYKNYKKHILTGKAGTVYFWSSMTLHGTKPTKSDEFRISLRYTIKKNKNNKKVTIMDKILSKVDSKKGLNIMRDDIDWESKDYKQVKFDKVLK